MKQFNRELAKQGKPLQTRDGDMKKTKPKRNLKLFNHWLAEVRSIASKKWKFNIDEDTGEKTRVDEWDINYVFDKATMEDYFKEGLSPKEAFLEETSYWE